MALGNRFGWIGSTIVALVVLVSGAPRVSAGTIQGTLRYAGGTIAGSFSGMVNAKVWAGTGSGGKWGTVDLATETYRVEDLPAGQYSVSTVVSPFDNPSTNETVSGELSAYTPGIQVQEAGTVTQDIDLTLAVHFTQPFDSSSVLPGDSGSCPKGAPTPATFTLAWEAVPLAASYDVRVRRQSCTPSNTLADVTTTVTATSTQVLHQQVLGEEHVAINIYAYDAGGASIGVMPTIRYSQGYAYNTLVLYANVDVSRISHPLNSWFIVQGAHWPGVPPTVWGTDMILTNPGVSDVAALIRFTPRDADGSTTYDQETVTVPAGGSVILTDIVSSLFGKSSPGSFEITPKSVEVMTRTYTPGGAGGTYGQGYGPIGTDDIAYTGGTHTTLGAGGVQKGAFRTNLSLVEVWGEQVIVRVILKDGNGVQLGTPKEYTIKPFSNIQLNDLVGKVGGPSTLSGGQVVVEIVSGSGRVAGALSVVDQTTDDPTTIPLVPR